LWLCLTGAAGAALYVLLQPGNGPPFLPSLQLQLAARAATCSPPSRVVAGSYQASPIQPVGDYLVITYHMQCLAPGMPAQYLEGYEAWTRVGDCSGQSVAPLAAPSAAGGPAAIEVFGASGCGMSGMPDILLLTHGLVSGAGAVTVEATFADGTTTTVPVQNGRFTIIAASASPLCLLRALDTQGAGLAVAEQIHSQPGAGCP
jgi:hypothetical protein